MRALTRAALTGAATVTVAFTASPALAAPDPAQPARSGDCTTLVNGSTTCYKQQGTSRFSDDQSMVNQTYRVTGTAPDGTKQYENSGQVHSVSSGNQTNVRQSNKSETPAQTCTTTIHYVVANGEFKKGSQDGTETRCR